ncbi:caspase family protein [Dactylosporangium sp. CA-139066]|uniref:caspase family protein n=1 Tax=Dactylosporangium sp. CA-139066 TaxID=3239930 RepID=UPI003D8C6DD4
MARTALLIGSDYNKLRGVQQDLDAMEATLSGRGFTVRRCGPPDATREGILDAYERLIADTERDDAVVVFYSGHGGWVETGPEARDERGYRPLDMQFIVPLDFDPQAADFRGITGIELSLLQRRLTDKTHNVTVILDCCHSGQMSRDERVARTVPPMPYRRIRDHIDRLVAEGLPIQRYRSAGNDHAVRIVACAPFETSSEYLSLDAGNYIGAMTEALTLTLAEVGDTPVTWATVMDRVRKRVVDLRFPQRPDAEGPSNRIVFTTEHGDLLTSLPVTPADRAADRARLSCAPLLGVQTGDEFMIMPAGSTAADKARRVGDLVVDKVGSMVAEGPVTFARGFAGLPTGARAFRTKVTAPRIRVRVPADDPRTRTLLERLPMVGLVQLAEPDDPSWVAEVTVEADGRLTLHDRLGPLHPPRLANGDGIGDLLRSLKVLGQATHLRGLVQSPSGALHAPVTIEWGLVEAGQARPLEPAGETVAAGGRIYVTVRNKGLETVYVSLLDIGVSGGITVLTRSSPAGRELSSGETYTFGRDERSNELLGAGLSWPRGLEPRHARDETLLVVVTSDRLDLSPLEQPGHRESRAAPRWGGVSPLQDMIDQLYTAGARDVDPQEDEGVRYDIHAIDFTLTERPLSPRAA